jgi:acetyl/propionyl-CoA carboxylase alpha subunit
MYKILGADKSYEIEIDKTNKHKGTLNGEAFELDLLNDGDQFHLLKNGKSYNIALLSANTEEKVFELMVNGSPYRYEAKDRFDLLLKELGMENLAATAANDLKAPMPGLVLKVEVEAGQSIQKGDPLIVLEAMKMENVLKSPADATIKSVEVEVGQAVEKNQVLIAFEA